MKTMLALSILLLCALAHAGDMKVSLKLYLDCDSEEMTAPHLRFLRPVKLCEGKFGKSFCFAKSGENLLDRDGWILTGGASVSTDGGYLKFVAKGTAAQAMFQLSKNNILSGVYSGSAFRVKLRHRNTDKVLAEFPESEAPSNFSLQVSGRNEDVILLFEADAAGEIAHLMFEKGLSFPLAYVVPGKKRFANAIRIDKADQYLNQLRGSFSCWLNAEWLKRETQGAASTIFAIYSASTIQKYNSDNFVLGTWFSPRHNKNKSYFSVLRRNLGEEKGAGITVAGESIISSEEWRHLLINWDTKDGKSVTSIFFDGGKTVATKTSDTVIQCKPLYGYLGMIYDEVALNGLIDDIAIFDRPLRPEEIEKIYSSGIPLGELLNN